MSTLRLGIAALAIACTASVAAAQNTTAPADTAPTPPADTTAAPTPPADTTATPPADTAATETVKSAPAMAETDREKPPLPGANSFTEGQARDRITKAGFEDVQQLKKDDQGIWRGQAKKSGQQVGVALDYRGNIVQQ
jgi:Peptidase propeptide and YPEB domain